MILHAAFVQQQIIYKQMPHVDAASVGRKGRADKHMSGIQMFGQRLRDLPDIARVSAVESRVDLEDDLRGPL